jgi:hypothetical protein
MTFNDLLTGEAVFVDTDILVYAFARLPPFGQACMDFLEQIENKLLRGYSSPHVLSEMAHRLMTVEASSLFGWSTRGIAHRLRRHHSQIQQLSLYRQAIDETSLIGIQDLPIDCSLVSLAADVSRQFGLLSSDALIVTVMRANGLTHLASNDADFDRVPGITRYAPA